MSVVDKVVEYLQKADLSKINAEVDREERVTITRISPDPFQSLENGELVLALDYTRKDGSAHSIVIQTKFQRHDDANKISVDGVAMNTIVVDPDVMTDPQLEFRYNNAAEQTGAAIPDNEVTYQSGEGNHEFRILA